MMDEDDNMFWNSSEEDGNIRSECQEDEGTDCEDGGSNTDWCRQIESDMLIVKYFFSRHFISGGACLRLESSCI